MSELSETHHTMSELSETHHTTSEFSDTHNTTSEFSDTHHTTSQLSDSHHTTSEFSDTSHYVESHTHNTTSQLRYTPSCSARRAYLCFLISMRTVNIVSVRFWLLLGVVFGFFPWMVCYYCFVVCLLVVVFLCFFCNN